MASIWLAWSCLIGLIFSQHTLPDDTNVIKFGATNCETRGTAMDIDYVQDIYVGGYTYSKSLAFNTVTNTYSGTPQHCFTTTTKPGFVARYTGTTQTWIRYFHPQIISGDTAPYDDVNTVDSVAWIGLSRSAVKYTVSAYQHFVGVYLQMSKYNFQYYFVLKVADGDVAQATWFQDYDPTSSSHKFEYSMQNLLFQHKPTAPPADSSNDLATYNLYIGFGRAWSSTCASDDCGILNIQAVSSTQRTTIKSETGSTDFRMGIRSLMHIEGLLYFGGGKRRTTSGSNYEMDPYIGYLTTSDMLVAAHWALDIPSLSSTIYTPMIDRIYHSQDSTRRLIFAHGLPRDSSQVIDSTTTQFRRKQLILVGRDHLTGTTLWNTVGCLYEWTVYYISTKQDDVWRRVFDMYFDQATNFLHIYFMETTDNNSYSSDFLAFKIDSSYKIKIMKVSNLDQIECNSLTKEQKLSGVTQTQLIKVFTSKCYCATASSCNQSGAQSRYSHMIMNSQTSSMGLLQLCSTHYFGSAMNSYQQRAVYIYKPITTLSDETSIDQIDFQQSSTSNQRVSITESKDTIWATFKTGSTPATPTNLRQKPLPSEFVASSPTYVPFLTNHVAATNAPSQFLIDQHIPVPITPDPYLIQIPLLFSSPANPGHDFEMIYSFEKYAGFSDWRDQLTYPWESNANYSTTPTQIVLTKTVDGSSNPVLQISLPATVTDTVPILAGREYWFYLTARNIYGVRISKLCHIRTYCPDDYVTFSSPLPAEIQIVLNRNANTLQEMFNFKNKGGTNELGYTESSPTKAGCSFGYYSVSTTAPSTKFQWPHSSIKTGSICNEDRFDPAQCLKMWVQTSTSTIIKFNWIINMPLQQTKAPQFVIPIKIMVSNCNGQEVVSWTNSNSFPTLQFQQSAVANTFDNTVMLDPTYKSFATSSDQTNCPIYDAQLRTQDNSAVSSDPKVTLTNEDDLTLAKFNIQIDIAMENFYSLRFRSITSKFASTAKLVKVIVCGQETLTAVSPLPKLVSAEVGLLQTFTQGTIFTWFNKSPADGICLQNDIKAFKDISNLANPIPWTQDNQVQVTGSFGSKVLEIKVSSKLPFRFYVQSKTLGGAVGYQEIQVSVLCDRNSIIRSANNKKLTFAFNQYQSDDSSTPNQAKLLSNLWDDMLTFIGCDQCLEIVGRSTATSYVYNLNDSTSKELQPLLVSLDSTYNIKVNTSTSFSPITFLIEGKPNPTLYTTCNYFDPQTIEVQVEVCGFEKILKYSNNAYVFQTTLSQDPDYKIANLTGNFYVEPPSVCNPVWFELWNETWISLNKTSTKPIWSRFISVEQQTGVVTVKHSYNPGLANNTEIKLYFVAFSPSMKYSMSELVFQFKYPPTNNPPVFINPLPIFYLEVNSEELKKGFKEPYAMFNLSDVSDQEGDQILFELEFQKPFLCQCVDFVELNGVSYIKVDKRRVTPADEGLYQGIITLKDDSYLTFYRKNVYPFTLNITYMEIESDIVKATQPRIQKKPKSVIVDDFVLVGPQQDQYFQVSEEDVIEQMINFYNTTIKDMEFSPLSETHLPVELKIQKVTLDGFIYIKFNQELIKPPFADFQELTNENVNFQGYDTQKQDPLKWAEKEFGRGFLSHTAKKELLNTLENRVQVQKKTAEKAIQKEQLKQIIQEVSKTVNTSTVPPAYEESQVPQNQTNINLQNPKWNDMIDRLAAQARVRDQALNSSAGGKRALQIRLDQLNVERDVLQFKVNLRSDVSPELIKYTLQITEWTSSGLVLKINFEDPKLISVGNFFDQAFIIIKNRNLFIAKNTGLKLDSSKNILLEYFPEQILKGVDAQLLEKNSLITGKLVMALILTLSITSLILLGNLFEVWNLYFTLQLACYYKVYELNIPHSALLYMDNMTDIIEFDWLNIQNWVQTLGYPEFSFRKIFYGVGEEYMIERKEQLVTIFDGYQFYLTVLLFLILAGIFLKLKQKQNPESKLNNQLLDALQRGLRFNWLIRAFTVSYLVSCYHVCFNFRTWAQNSDYIDDPSKGFVCVMTFLILVYPVFCTYVLSKAKTVLGHSEVMKQIQCLYEGVHLFRDPYNTLYYPGFIFRRLIFVLIPMFFYMFPWLQLQLLLFSTSLYMIWYVNLRPHEDKYVFFVLSWNEVMHLILCYHLVCFTDLVQNENAKFQMGYSMVGCCSILVFSNLFFIVFRQVSSYVYFKKLQMKLKLNFKKFAQNQADEIIFNMKQELEEAFVKKQYKKKVKKLQKQFAEDPEFQKPNLEKLSLDKEDKRFYKKKLKIKTNCLVAVEDEQLKEQIAQSVNEALQSEIGTFGDLVDMARKSILEDYVKNNQKFTFPEEPKFKKQKFVASFTIEKQPEITFDKTFTESSKQRWQKLHEKYAQKPKANSNPVRKNKVKVEQVKNLSIIAEEEEEYANKMEEIEQVSQASSESSDESKLIMEQVMNKYNQIIADKYQKLQKQAIKRLIKN